MTVLYKVLWKSSAKKELKKIDRKFIPSILSAVEKLTSEPRPVSSKKLVGSEHTYRIRIMDYRVVYSIEDDILLIEVLKVKHRKDVYKN